MYILGMRNSLDAGAALVKDGALIATANEERFSRIKMHKDIQWDEMRIS